MNEKGGLYAKRAGVSINASADASIWTAKSRFWPKYSGEGTTQLQCLDSYLEAIQEPERWREACDYLFLGDECYKALLIDSSYELQEPTGLWNGLIDYVFTMGYSHHEKYSLIERVYAYSEWCLAQQHQIPERNLSSAVVICFYESIPRQKEALADLHHWFTYEEAIEVFLGNPFMLQDAELLHGAYGY